MHRLFLAAICFCLAGCATHSADYLALQQRYSDAARPTITSMTSVLIDGQPGLRVTGTAPAVWFIENQFPASVSNEAGVGTAMTAYGSPDYDHPDDPVPWGVDLRFDVANLPATLSISADQEFEMDEVPPAPSFTFPVTLTPQ